MTTRCLAKCIKTLMLKTHVSSCSRKSFSSCTKSIIKRRNEIFDTEVKRQRTMVGRVEKIEVRYLGLPQDVTFAVNRDISTPYNLAQHLSIDHWKRSALALVDGSKPWDMHRPLKDTCTLQLLNFTIEESQAVNKAFWRTCSFMLGAALRNIVKPEANLELHSFPSPNIKSGSFIHDIVLSNDNWQPNNKELRAISAEMVKMAAQDIKIERLDINSSIAMQMFKETPFKRDQLPSILQQGQGQLTVYRLGTHIDISRGPMVASSRFLGKCTIAAVHKLPNDGNYNFIYRVQGVALPVGFSLNHVAYGILEQRASKMNAARLPNELFEEAKMQFG